MKHTHILCLVLLVSGCLQAQTPPTPTGLVATAFERHIELRWDAATAPGTDRYKLYRSTDGGAVFTLLKTLDADHPYSFDWTGDEGLELTRHYTVRAVSAAGQESPDSPVSQASTFQMDDAQLRDMTQMATFRYFWDFAHPVSGMARERNSSGDIVTTGGSGFGVMALVCGAERGWASRDEVVLRLLQLVSFLQNADRFHGVLPHWMNGNTGKAIAFSPLDNGGDLVETAFMMQGLLTARAYFDQDTPYEKALRDAITGLWEDVEWDWYRRNNSPYLYWHWSPDFAWQMNFPIRGFNEAHIIYLLAIASPTHPVPASLYVSGWASSNYTNPSIQFGLPVFTGPFAGGPLFFSHYSYLGFDPRNLRDNYCNYFTRNRNHALIHHAYSIANPENHSGYSADCWGLTASDDPGGYAAHDPYPTNDNGTIAPTAALSSMPYTPDESMAALRHFYRVLGDRLWGDYGFKDAFNLNQNWFADSYLAIDQGPIVAMLENHRSGLLWENFMKNPEIKPALDAVGFVQDASNTQIAVASGPSMRVRTSPLQASDPLVLDFFTEKATTLHVTLTDALGQRSAALGTAELGAGASSAAFSLIGLPSGVYWVRACEQNTHVSSTQKLVIMR
jgi:hypothetical protein